MIKIAKYVLFLLLLLGEGSLRAQNADGSRFKLAVYATVMGINDEQSVKNIKAIAQGTSSNALIGSGKYEMIERSGEFLQQIEAEQKYQMSGDVRDDQISQIGASYGAQKVCVVGITISGSYCYVSARIVDVVTKTSSEAGDADNENYTSIAKIRPTVLAAIDQILGTEVTNAYSSQAPTVVRNPNGSDKSFTINGVTFKTIFVQGGSFQMGSYENDDEKPVHSVTVSDFYISEFEVTQELWQAVMGTTVYQQRDKANNSLQLYGVGAQYPICYVNYYEAAEFCTRLNNMLRGKLPVGYRIALPSEAEWEYAARGGNKSKQCIYSGSNVVSDVANNTGNSHTSTHVVGIKLPNELGLYDMSGNVWEWCEDWYDKNYYSVSSLQNPHGASTGSNRVMRGGSWGSHITYCRVAYRGAGNPENRTDDCGFRFAIVRR